MKFKILITLLGAIFFVFPVLAETILVPSPESLVKQPLTLDLKVPRPGTSIEGHRFVVYRATLPEALLPPHFRAIFSLILKDPRPTHTLPATIQIPPFSGEKEFLPPLSETRRPGGQFNLDAEFPCNNQLKKRLAQYIPGSTPLLKCYVRISANLPTEGDAPWHLVRNPETHDQVITNEPSRNR